MPDVQWDSEASLMRVTSFDTAEPMEELVARGTVFELVGAVLDMPAGQQRGLLIRAAGPDWVEEYDEATIRELAARPEFTGAHGDFDTADLADDPDVREASSEETYVTGSIAGPSHTDARGRDGEK